MSDVSDYYSGSESDSENSDNELPKSKPQQPSFVNKIIYNSESESESESDSDNESSSDDSGQEDENNIVGGSDDEVVNIDKKKNKFDNYSDDEGVDLVEGEDEEDNDNDDEDEDIEIDETGQAVESTNKPVNNTITKKPVQLIIDNDDDDDDEYDENYLQKFDSSLKKNYIDDYHPECLNHNYDEIEKLSVVVRNSSGIVVDPLHKTIPCLTKYERARILGQRAKQIETGAKPLVKLPENVIDSYIIAELELREKKIPFIIRRPIPGGACEYWKLQDLEIIGY
jgi:DNA-directed RNA polymerase I, II, and III subunit RPABC2